MSSNTPSSHPGNDTPIFRIKLIVIYAMLFHFCSVAYSLAALGVPLVTNYTEEDYGGGPNIHAVVSDSSGMVYIGTEESIKCFDGEHWVSYKVPTEEAVSLAVDSNDNIYVGGFQEFGILEKKANGERVYRSLIGSLSEQYKPHNYGWKCHMANSCSWRKYLFCSR